MNEVNKTLYIPLYGKAFVSKQGIILKDTKAEYIWEKEGFELNGKSKSKWLAYYMGMRSAVFDTWVKEKMNMHKDAVVLHLGCGMDSRCERVQNNTYFWYDIDFEDVIKERSKYYSESDTYHMIGSNLSELDWKQHFPGNKDAIIVMEGVSMYLTSQELIDLFSNISTAFHHVYLLMDVYSEFAAKASKHKNPINDVGVHQVYGVDDPTILKSAGFTYLKEHDMTPMHYINQLSKMERKVFSSLYSGKLARNLYHLYEYEK